MLALVSAHPRLLAASIDQRDLPVGVDVPALIRDVDREAFRPIFPLDGAEHTKSEANRTLLPGKGPAEKDLRAFLAYHPLDHPALMSHAISRECAKALHEHRAEDAIAERRKALESLVSSLGDRLGGWGRSDRPSIEYLLAQVAQVAQAGEE
jgi:hypothetical protein